jgi:dTDP-4-amino-4,6-dideoxygalactose transaminase
MININLLKDKFKILPVSGHLENNPNNIILDFEKELLKHCSSKPEDYQCVIVDSLTNAFGMCLMVNNITFKDIDYVLPDRTYISMYSTLHTHNCNEPILKDIQWINYYTVGNIIDSATYLPNKDLENMFTEDIDFILLSFGNKKPLSNNRGGAIIFKKNNTLYNFLKRYSHNGRDSAIPVDKDNLLCFNNRIFGQRFNLVPEQVEVLRTKLKNNNINDVKGKYLNYPSITELKSRFG